MGNIRKALTAAAAAAVCAVCSVLSASADITGDINKDGTVDLLDSVILSQYVAGWEQAKTYFTA